jgi:DNA-binding beta-propeller fold protein YncE
VDLLAGKPKPSRRVRRLVAAVAAILVAAGCADQSSDQRDSASPLRLRAVGEIVLPGDNSRFDYAGLDAERGLLFIAHLGAGELVEVDTRAQRVVRTIPHLAQVHGVLVVGSLNRVYATATGVNQVVAIDENTGGELGRAPTGQYPDGLAYDPRRNAIWTTNETAGTETIIDAATLAPRGTVDLGGEVGNVGYDPDSDRMLVAVQGRNDLAVIDPAAMTVVQRVPLPGCDHPHGLAIDATDRLVFMACDQNAALITIDQTDWRTLGTNAVGEDPDVLAYDAAAHRLYVAAESGIITVLDIRNHRLAMIGSTHLANNAHVVVVDPHSHRSYYPIQNGSGGRPVLLEREPT